jgi:hypothetical protein
MLLAQQSNVTNEAPTNCGGFLGDIASVKLTGVIMFGTIYAKKPSITTVRAHVRKGLNSGHEEIVLTCGENEITIIKTHYGLVGSGWIGKISGQDLANEFIMTT